MKKNISQESSKEYDIDDAMALLAACIKRTILDFINDGLTDQEIIAGVLEVLEEFINKSPEFVLHYISDIKKF